MSQGYKVESQGGISLRPVQGDPIFFKGTPSRMKGEVMFLSMKGWGSLA